MNGRIEIAARHRRSMRRNLNSAGEARLSLNLSTDLGSRVVDIDLPLAGPGQLTSLAQGAVRHRNPAHRAGDHRAGALAYIEFHDPGLPWALSFNEGPCLGLICVPEGDSVTLSAQSVPNPVLTIAGLASGLPDPTLFALMAHVQKEGSGSFSRMLCPQELRPRTRYIAALVPLTRAGARAGLGEPPASDTIGSGNFAWSTGDENAILPALDWWSFSTGGGRSAEDILRDLRVNDVSAETEELALSDESASLLGVPVGSTVPRATLLTDQPQTFDEMPALVPALDRQTPGGEPRLPLPSYGRHYAKAKDAGSRFRPGRDPLWLRQLNRTPSYRIMAGRGTELVRRHQDEMVGFVRRSAGQIEDANMLLGRAALSMRVGAQVHVAIRDLSDEGVLRLAGPAAARLRIDTSDGRSLEEAVRGTAAAATRSTTLRRRAGPGGTPGARTRDVKGDTLYEATRRVARRMRNSDVVAGASPVGSWARDTAPAGRGSFLSQTERERLRSGDRGSPGEWRSVLRALQERDGLARTSDPRRETALGKVAAEETARRFRPPGPIVGRAPVATLASRVRNELNPTASVPPRLRARIAGAPELEQRPLPARLLHDPVWPEPILERLFDLDPAALAPGLSDLPADSVTGLMLDGAALEAVVAGANHELLRELVWRGLPTARRPSPIRRAFPAPAGEDPDTFDTEPIANWSATEPLGTEWNGRIGFMTVIRSDLFRLYPSVLLYLCPALWTGDRRVPNPNAALSYPVAMGQIGMDLIYVGFAESARQMVGSPRPSDSLQQTSAGSFLVFEEPESELSFGLGGRNGALARTANEIVQGGGWQSLDWDDLPGADLRNDAFDGLQIDGLEWSRSSTDMAGILLERPTVMAIHGTDLLGVAP